MYIHMYSYIHISLSRFVQNNCFVHRCRHEWGLNMGQHTHDLQMWGGAWHGTARTAGLQ